MPARLPAARTEGPLGPARVGEALRTRLGELDRVSLESAFREVHMESAGLNRLIIDAANSGLLSEEEKRSQAVNNQSARTGVPANFSVLESELWRQDDEPWMQVIATMEQIPLEEFSPFISDLQRGSRLKEAVERCLDLVNSQSDRVGEAFGTITLRRAKRCTALGVGAVIDTRRMRPLP
jgi:hypothetical protein